MKKNLSYRIQRVSKCEACLPFGGGGGGGARGFQERRSDKKKLNIEAYAQIKMIKML